MFVLITLLCQTLVWLSLRRPPHRDVHGCTVRVLPGPTRPTPHLGCCDVRAPTRAVGACTVVWSCRVVECNTGGGTTVHYHQHKTKNLYRTKLQNTGFLNLWTAIVRGFYSLFTLFLVHFSVFMLLSCSIISFLLISPEFFFSLHLFLFVSFWFLDMSSPHFFIFSCFSFFHVFFLLCHCFGSTANPFQ